MSTPENMMVDPSLMMGSPLPGVPDMAPVQPIGNEVIEEPLIRGDHFNLKYKQLANFQWLDTQYRIIGKTATEISDESGIPAKAIERRIKKFGIRRPRRSFFCSLKKCSQRGLDGIVDKYTNEKKSCKEISGEYGCSETTISYFLKKRGIPKRTSREVASEHCKRINALPVSEHRKLKLSMRMALDRNPQWRGGKSYEPYSPEFTEKKRDDIRKKYGNVCQMCFIPDRKLTLCVHHVDYNKKNNKDYNLVPLCHGCHGVTTVNRDLWKMFFYFGDGVVNGQCVN